MIKQKIHPDELIAEEFLNRLGKFLSRFWKLFRKEFKRFIKWFFFYKPENDMDGLFHIITVIAYILIGVVLARGW